MKLYPIYTFVTPANYPTPEYFYVNNPEFLMDELEYSLDG